MDHNCQDSKVIPFLNNEMKLTNVYSMLKASAQERKIGPVDLRPIFQRIMTNLIRDIAFHFFQLECAGV